MIIDFHTHTFPDRIANSALSTLSKKANLTPCTDGTAKDTDQKMRIWGVDKRVMLSIATNPKQQTNVNNFAIEMNNNDTVFAFGSIHPEADNAEEELERLKNAGISGIKLHPEYQNFAIDDKKMYPIYEKCIKLGLVIVFHAGKDLAYPDSLNASPEAIYRLSRDFGGADFVMAHFGSCMLYEKALEFVAGCGFYIDTSFSKGRISPSLAESIIKKQGADKVLFGSDCPWETSLDNFNFINSLNLTDEEKDLIFYKNALKLLKK